MDAIAYERDGSGVVTLTIDLPGQPANTMSPVFRQAFEQVVQRLEAERQDVKGVILTSGKPTFFAGGDLKRLLAVGPADADGLFASSMGFKSLMRRLELLGRPVVAAINGTALGGGFELCLACHARFAIADPQVRIGLPEVSLGLLPGGGGIVRLVRMLGVQAALPLLLRGSGLAPAQAMASGLLDGLVADRAALLAAARAWIERHPDAVQPWDRAGFRLPGADGADAVPPQWLARTRAELRELHQGLYPAPEAVLSAAMEGARCDVDEASRIESRYLVQLATHPVTKNLISTFFFQLKVVRAGRWRPEGLPRARFRRAAIAGPDRAAMARLLERAGLEVAPEGRVAGCDVVVELRALPQDADPAEQPATLRLPATGGHVDLRFLLPLQDRQLVEIVRHPGTSPVAAAHAHDFLLQLGKVAVLVRGPFSRRLVAARREEMAALLRDGEGVPDDDARDRLLHAQVQEGLRCLEQGVVATAAELDVGSVLGADFPRWSGGVLRYVEQVGEQAFARRADELADRYGARFRLDSGVPSVILRKLST